MSWKRYPEERPGRAEEDSQGFVLSLNREAGHWNLEHVDDLARGDIWHPLPPVPSEEELSE